MRNQLWNDICIEIVLQGVISTAEIATEVSMAEYHSFYVFYVFISWAVE